MGRQRSPHCSCVAQEYSGIDWQRLQRMEARLRNDVLREAASMGGRLLVAREAARSEPEDASTPLDMEDDFEPVTGARAN